MLNWINDISISTNNFTEGLSAKKIKMYNSFYNNLLKLMNKYNNGVPESDIQYISNKLNIKIEIKLPFECKYIGNIISTIPMSSWSNNKKDIIKTFTYINNRINHIEHISSDSFTNLSTNNNKIVESSNDMINIYNKLLNDPVQKYEFSYKKFNHNINKIYTKDYTYILTDTHYWDSVKEFENMYNIQSYKFDTLHPSNKSISNYIFDSIHFNSCIDMVSLVDLMDIWDDKNIKQKVTQIDMTKAYSNFHCTLYYNGFLGKIHKFHWMNLNSSNSDFYTLPMGIYTIDNIIFPQDSKFSNIFNMLNIYKNKTSYPLPEL